MEGDNFPDGVIDSNAAHCALHFGGCCTASNKVKDQ